MRTLTLYRVVKTSPPTTRDFLSYRALGIPLRHRTARALRLWDGLSVYRTGDQAASLIARSPRLGAFVAELRIPVDGLVRLELDNGGEL